MPNGLYVLTFGHVVVSLIAIALGVPALVSILAHQNKSKLIVSYFLFTAMTTLSGFAFPITRFTPGIAFGLLTLVLLAVVWVAIPKLQQSRGWHFSYLTATLGTWYLNCVVLIVQSFQKIPALKSLAPTQTEPPFLVAQLFLLMTAGLVLLMEIRNLRVVVRT